MSYIVERRILREEPLLLKDAERELGVSYQRLRRWAARGLRSGTDRQGELVRLSVCRLPSGVATSRAALERFYASLQNSGSEFFDFSEKINSLTPEKSHA